MWPASTKASPSLRFSPKSSCEPVSSKRFRSLPPHLRGVPPAIIDAELDCSMLDDRTGLHGPDVRSCSDANKLMELRGDGPGGCRREKGRPAPRTRVSATNAKPEMPNF